MADELTDEEVFAPTKELTDDEVFNQSVTAPTAPEQPPSAMSPAEEKGAVVQAAQDHPAVENAVEALAGTASSLIPKTAGQLGEMAAGTFAPAVQAVRDIGTTGQSLYDVLFGGKSIEETNAANRPEAATLSEVDKTPAFSKERFRAGFDVLAQIGMAAAVGRGLQPKPGLHEVSTGEKVEPEIPVAATEATVKSPLVQQVNEGLKRGEADEPLVASSAKDISEAFKTMKGAVTNSYADVIWKKVEEGRPIERIAPLENQLREAQKAGTLKTREDVAAIIQGYGKEPSPVSQPTETTTAQPLTQEGVTQPEARTPIVGDNIQSPSGKSGQIPDQVGKATEAVLEPPDSVLAKLSFGNEAKVGEVPSFISRTTSRGKQYDFSLSEYDLPDGRKRFTLSAGGELVDAGALVKLTPEGPEIQMLHAGKTGFEGLGGALAKEITKRYGKPVVPEGTPLSEATKRFGQGTETKPPQEVAYPSLTEEDKTKLSSMTVEQANKESASAMQKRDDLIKSGATQGSAEYQRANDYASAVLDKAQQGGIPTETPPSGETPPTTPEAPPVSTKNEYTEAQREVRGLPEAEQAAKRGFGKVWDEAAAQAEKDPTIGRRLVDEINAKPRPVSDTENAHLLRHEIEVQKEHSNAIDAVNSATTDADLTAAKSRLELARTDLQNVYDATKSAGTKGGQALAARKMLANEDYSLAKMEARRRAANDGQPLTEPQLAETSELHAKITELQSKLDAHEVAATFEKEFSKLVDESRREARTAKSSGTKFTDFLDRKADEARARITDRRGRLTTGFDPTSITDEAVIGASHIAKGLTKFADWSVEMAKEFGEQIRPFLKDIWERARSFHDANAKEYGDKALSRYKTYLGKQTEQIKSKIEAGDFTKPQRQKTQLDKEAFNMRADLQKLKNQFERGVAKEAYQKKTPAQKFWDHFVGVERAMKLSGPEVFGKLGVAAAVREVLAPIESAGGYAVSKAFPKLASGTRYGADLATTVRAELKAKAALFTDGMKDAWQNVKGKETGLEAIGGGKTRPDFWYNRIGQMHAAIKAPVKRAEFARSLEKGMAEAVKNGEDINHPEVMTRLANESVMDANRAIFQNKTVVSGFFSMLERQSPAAGRVARFLFPVVKIPVNLFKELVNLHVGAPVGAARIGAAYWKGVETLPELQREAIIRQLVKGSVGGAGLLWGYYNSDKVRNFFDHAPTWFNHTPMAMILNEGSHLKQMQAGGDEAKKGRKELAYMAKTDIPFMYTIKDIGDALDTHNSHAILGWINNMTQSTVVPQIATQTAKAMDKPGTFPSNIGEKPTYRPAANPLDAVKLGIPGLRQQVPEKEAVKHTSDRRLRRR